MCEWVHSFPNYFTGIHKQNLGNSFGQEVQPGSLIWCLPLICSLLLTYMDPYSVLWTLLIASCLGPFPHPYLLNGTNLPPALAQPPFPDDVHLFLLNQASVIGLREVFSKITKLGSLESPLTPWHLDLFLYISYHNYDFKIDVNPIRAGTHCLTHCYIFKRIQHRSGVKEKIIHNPC